MKLHVGMDVHKKFCQVTVMNSEGKVLDRNRVASNKESLAEYFEKIPRPACVSMEAGRSWYWINDALEELGLEVKLSHPKKTRIISEATVSTDKIDSEVLAHLERMNYLPTAYIPPKDIRLKRELLRYRISLVQIKTLTKNKIHSVIDKLGIRHEFSDLFGKAGIAFLETIEADKIFRNEIKGYMKILELLNKEIKKIGLQTKKLVDKEIPEARLLMTIPGIGYYSALLLISEIVNIERFASYKKLCAYAGVVPRIDESAGKARLGRIMKDSNKYIRTVLIEAVDNAVKKDPGLYYFYEKLSRTKGKGKARVAIARKLLISIYFMLRDQKSYHIHKRSKRINYFSSQVNPSNS